MRLEARVLLTLSVVAALNLPPALPVQARHAAPSTDPPAAPALSHAPPTVDLLAKVEK